MSEARGKTSRLWTPEPYRHEAQSPEAKLPQAALGFFWLDTVPDLALRRFYAPYEEETRGAPPCAPQMLVCLWRYASGGGGVRAARAPKRVRATWRFSLS
jgi:hypothetical protein